ncbi:MAG: hypothetical protein WDO14_11795 [Bacteroidota bacterium]
MFIKRYISFIIIAIAVAGCSPAYVPNSRNVPLFEKGAELAVNASYGFSGTEVQVAYSITDHIAAMANVSAKWKTLDQPVDDSIKRRHFFGEAGLGYYLAKEDYRFELFGGYGKGKSLSNAGRVLDEQERLASGRYDRIFIQPSISTNFEKFNLIFTSRVSFVNFTSFTPYPDQSYSFLFKPVKGYHTFFEPSITGRFPMGNILRGYFQGGVNVALRDYYYYYNYSGLHFAVGLQLRLGSFYKDGN